MMEVIIECSPEVSVQSLCDIMSRSPDWMPGILIRGMDISAIFIKRIVDVKHRRSCCPGGVIFIHTQIWTTSSDNAVAAPLLQISSLSDPYKSPVRYYPQQNAGLHLLQTNQPQGN